MGATTITPQGVSARLRHFGLARYEPPIVGRMQVSGRQGFSVHRYSDRTGVYVDWLGCPPADAAAKLEWCGWLLSEAGYTVATSNNGRPRLSVLGAGDTSKSEG